MSLRRLLALALVLFAITGCSAALPVAAEAPQVDLPPELGEALAHEYGEFDAVVTRDDLLNDLQNADVVCIGEAHYDLRDMETAFEIARELAKRGKIALAVERFPYDLQPALDRLNAVEDDGERLAQVEAILASDAYQTVWGRGSFGQIGYPVNTPSQPVFEAMVRWAAQSRIPLIALDVTLAERGQGFGEDMVWRNQLWAEQVENFSANHPQGEYQIVVVGGINHMTNAPDAFPSLMKSDGTLNVISIGQRDAMYQYLSSEKVDRLAESFHMDDLIVRHPQFALVNIKGIPVFLDPPDYWITAHTPSVE